MSQPLPRLPLQRLTTPPPLPIGRRVRVHAPHVAGRIGVITHWRPRYAPNRRIAGLDAVVRLDGDQRMVVVDAAAITPAEWSERD